MTTLGDTVDYLEAGRVEITSHAPYWCDSLHIGALVQAD